MFCDQVISYQGMNNFGCHKCDISMIYIVREHKWARQDKNQPSIVGNHKNQAELVTNLQERLAAVKNNLVK